MNYRYELKHEINYSDLLILRQRLNAVMKRDSHTVDGKYKVRSLYFDNFSNKAFHEKLNGINTREKFRFRYYNYDKSFIRLEKKSKKNGLNFKESVMLTEKEVQSIIDGDLEWMKASNHSLVRELYDKMIYDGLRPKTIVDYIREPFVYAPGNVRVTLDYEICTGFSNIDFLNPDCINIPIVGSPIILEVKWGAFLPDIIKDIIQLTGRQNSAFSKYAISRIYG